MSERTISDMTGIKPEHIRSLVDHHPEREARFAGMSEEEMREFLKEEQREGVHPSLKGKRF